MKTRLILLFLLIGTPAFAQNFRSFSQDGNSVLVRSETSSFQFTFYKSDILRMDFLPSTSTLIDSSYVVIQQPDKSIPVKTEYSDSLIRFSSSGLTVSCSLFPVRFTFSDSTGKILLAEPSFGGFSTEKEARKATFSLKPDDHFYGTGERGTSLDKRGQKFESYNTQIGGYSTPLPTMNLNVPFFTTTNGYSVYIDNTYKGIFDFGHSDKTTFSYTATGGELSFYLFAGKTVQKQLENYTWLTGRQPLPPRWAFGYIQSKNRYTTEEETRGIVNTIREKNFPCDAIVLDLAWFKHMGDISWDEEAWPNHEQMIQDFKLTGIKTILITETYLIEPSHNFKFALENGFFTKKSDGTPYLMPKWWSCNYGCNAALLDMTNPEARKWWWSLHPGSFGTSVPGIWTDLGEPERHPEDMIHFLGSTNKIHNIYNLLWAQTIFDGFNQLQPGKRVMNLTRSGFAGIQRYGVLPWSGDVARDFGGLAVQPPMLLNMGMSGLAYHNSDIGGYARNPTTPELYIRWMQYGVFSPIARAHGAGTNANGSPTEPWMFGKEAERISRDYLRLRYSLLPYIYTLAHENYKSGLPIARPLFFMDPSDKNLLNESDSYLWGDNFLISPVVAAGIREKEVVLPKGNWINFWTDEVVTGGGKISVSAPLDKMPIFVRSGSVIPMAPVMISTDERPLDTLIVRVYPEIGSTGSFTLYEDDGESLDYQKGAFSETTFTQSGLVVEGKQELTLTAEKPKGSFKGQVQNRIYLFEVRLMKEKPESVLADGEKIKGFSSLDHLRKENSGFFYDQKSGILFVQASGSLKKSVEIIVEKKAITR
ncbi:MAG: DUF5110 domain-containing protein [Bacteroidetes bacterium]|nr:DUF5110 domain-containing protein [Bacteroidota bacterium]